MTVEPQRKRRKWDVADPAGATAGLFTAQPAPLYQPALSSTPSMPLAPVNKPKLDAEAIRRAQQAAAAVVNKLNMEAVAKGTVPVSRLGVVETKSDISREVFINDAPTIIRHHLTKKTTQDDVQRKTHTVIVTRGRYYPAGSQIDPNEKPLHLRITPSIDAGHTSEHKQRAVNHAAAEIQRILQGERQSADANTASGPPSQPTTTIPVGFEAPPDFGLSERINGPGGSYLAHISSQTGSSVLLRGRGSGAYEGPEPLHLVVTAPTQEALRDSQRLATDLLQTVRNEFYRMYPHLMPPVPYTPGHNAPNAPSMYPPHPNQAPSSYAAPTSTPNPYAAPTSAQNPYAAPTNAPNPYAAPTSAPNPYAAPTSAPNPYAAPTSAPNPYAPTPYPMPAPSNPSQAPAAAPSMPPASHAFQPNANPANTTPAVQPNFSTNPALNLAASTNPAPQQAFSYPPPSNMGNTYAAPMPAATAPNPYAPPMATTTAPNPYATMATSAAPTTSMPQFATPYPYTLPVTSGVPGSAASLMPTASAALPNYALPMHLNAAPSAMQPPASSLPQGPPFNPYAYNGTTSMPMSLPMPSMPTAMGGPPQLAPSYQQPGYTPASYPHALTTAAAPATAGAPTWPATNPGVPMFSGIIGANNQQAAAPAAAPANPYANAAQAYAPPNPAPNNGLQSDVGGISVALQTAVAGMQTAVSTMQNLVNARGVNSPQPASPPKRRFREFKEHPPQNQAPQTAAASAQSGSVYAQHFPALGTMPAAAQLPQPAPQYQARPQGPVGAPTGSVKINAGIAGGLVDYEGDD